MPQADSIPLAVVDEREQQLKTEIAQFEQRLSESRIELRLLSQVRALAASSEPSNGSQRKIPRRAKTKAKSTSDMIRETLRDTPGLKPGEVVDRIQEHVHTQAKDVRRSLFSTIGGLKRRGHLHKDRKGRLYVVDR